MKTAILTFFDSYPPKTGSGNVCVDFFNLWASSNKKLFQFSEIKNKKKDIEKILIYKNSAFFKIISLPVMILKILKYFKKEKRKIIIIEGPSWIFYTFIVIFFFRVFYKNVFIIYRSHSIEYEIRLKNSNFFIAYLTRFFEDYVIKTSNLSTSVSKLEQKKFKLYYKKNTYLFPNSLDIDRLKKIKERKIKSIPLKYIIFSGSYDYKPNKIAINFIIDKILPKIKKNNIKLVLTGNHKKKFDNKDVINLGFVSMKQLKYLQRKSICLFVPLFEGYGTRIKILENLILGNRVISTSKGIEGIEYKNNKNVLVSNNLQKMVKGIIKFSQSKKISRIDNKSIRNFSMIKNSRKLLKTLSKDYVL